MRYNLLVLLLLLGEVGCGEVASQQPDASGNTNHNSQICSAGQSRCFGGNWQQCDQQTWVDVRMCLPPEGTCVHDLGCLQCAPGQRYCDGDTVRDCSGVGTPGTVLQTCDTATGESCSAGECLGACEAASLRRDYIGCEYWPTPTTNSGLGSGGVFDDNFGVVVHNANALAATVTVARNGQTLAEATVAPGELYTFELPIDTGLVMPVSGAASVLAAGAAYHLTSSLPVTVYQFNPLDYERDGDHSHSNDASLLLPAHVLTGDYIVMARQTAGVRPVVPDGQMFFGPGFVAVVGTAESTVVTITSSAHTAAGNGVAAMAPGEQRTFTVARGEVLQLVSQVPETCTGNLKDDEYCDMGAPYDLTGSVISASAPVAVYSGHDCSLVPFDTWACDHLEEQLPPLQTWGKEFVVSRTAPQNDAGHPVEPNLLRLVSGVDNNVIVVDPPLPGLGGSLTLNRGQWREVRTFEDVHVRGTGPLMIGQFMVGQNAYSPDWSSNHGDPSFGVVVPLEQLRQSYTFLAPTTIPLSYVNVTKRLGDPPETVYLDGVPIDEQAFGPAVGGSPFAVARLIIDGGGHTIESEGPVGISVYGFAPFTSYLYPGGLNLNHVNPVE